MVNLQLVLGGARSGKSRFAEQCAAQRAQKSDKQLIYIATATAEDDEMLARIKHHQQHRDSNWHVVEAPLKLAACLTEYLNDNYCVLVDCLTLWLSNCLCQHGVEFFVAERDKLLTLLSSANGQLIMVSNEVGHGIVPLGQLSRDFVDQAGWLHQKLAAHALQVDFIVAGLGLNLKSQPAQESAR